MGWAEASVAKRHVHVPDAVILGIADQVEGLLWAAGGQSAAGKATKGLTGKKRRKLLALLVDLLQDSDDTADDDEEGDDDSGPLLVV